MTHVNPNQRSDAPHGANAPPAPKPEPDQPTPTADDPDVGEGEQEAAHEATREADDNPSN